MEPTAPSERAGDCTLETAFGRLVRRLQYQPEMSPQGKLGRQHSIPLAGKAQNLEATQNGCRACVIRESNPGLYRGRVLFYH